MRKLFSLIAAVLFAGSMMAEPIVINATDVTTIETGAQTGLDVTLQGIRIVWEGAYYNNDQGCDMRVYAGKAMTFTAASNISKVEIIGFAKKDLAPTVTAGVITAGASYSADATKSDWTDPLLVVDQINATSLTINCNKQMRVYAIRFTLDGEAPFGSPKYYVAGNMTEWGVNEAYELVANPANEGEYMGRFAFEAGAEFKVIKYNGSEEFTWYPEGMGNNYTINEAGVYAVYFRPDGQGGEDWYHGFFNVIMQEGVLINLSEGLYFQNYVESEGWWQIYGGNEQYLIAISDLDTTMLEGTYTIDDLDPDYTYLGIINGADTAWVSFTEGSITLVMDEMTGDVTVSGTLAGNDNQTYLINLAFVAPKAEETVTVNIPEAELIDIYAAYGLYGVYGYDENNVMVLLSVWTEGTFQGLFSEQDLDYQYIGSGIMDGMEQPVIYQAIISVTPGNDGAYSIQAAVLCYNNKLYDITMIVPAAQGIEGVEAAVDAIKRLVNGNVVIEKAGKTYNMNGTRL